MISPELSAVFFGLLTAAGWGAGDFFGGLATKRSHVYSVVVISQLVGLIFLVSLALLLAEAPPSPNKWLWGALAGICGTIGLAALYQGLSRGRMGIVAPLAAVATAVVPMLFGFFLEGRPTSAQALGFVLALLAVWTISHFGERDAQGVHYLVLPLLAGLGFGFFLVAIGQISADSTLWGLVIARVTSITMFTIMVLISGQRKIPSRNQFLIIALSGVLDAGSNIFFALATQFGRLDVAAVLSSLYPASTVLLARLILNERLAARQWAGIGLALLAVVLISS